MRRRYQKGSLIKEAGGWYSVHRIDAETEDGTLTKQRKVFLGRVSEMSARAAQREHSRIMETVNQARGSVAPIIRGQTQTFENAAKMWRSAVAPNLSPATVRPRESQLRVHALPRFGQIALHEIGVHQLQQFATDLKKVVSDKTVVHVLSAIFAVLRYAGKCGIRVQKVGFADLQLGSTMRQEPAAFFTREQALQIIEVAREPFKTIFALAWNTGMRAGELLALTLDDLDFDHKTIHVNKAADDNTREIRQPKTKKSIATLPMPSALEAQLRDYVMRTWKPNPAGLLFPAPRKKGYPRSRENVVKVGLKPVLKKLGIPDTNTGLHAFRHGLATELADASVPVTVLQNQMRHADVKTTLRIYAHVIPQSQRDAMERVSGVQLLRTNESLRKFAVK